MKPDLYRKIESGQIRPSLSLFNKIFELLELDEITCILLMKQEMEEENETCNI